MVDKDRSLDQFGIKILCQSSRNLTSTPFYGLPTPHTLVQAAVLAASMSVSTITFRIAISDTERQEVWPEQMSVEQQ
jgi:hypothetical protein